MGKRRKHTVTRWIEDIVDDTKDFFDDVLDRVKDVEDDARDAIKDFVDSDDEDDRVEPNASVDARRITSELTILSAALEELTAKVNVLADMQVRAAQSGGGAAGPANPTTTAAPGATAPASSGSRPAKA